METKHFKNDKTCLTYLDAGSGPLLLFAHANGFPAGTYEPVLSELARGRRVVAPNICGQCECAAGVCDRQLEIKSWQRLSDKIVEFIRSSAGGSRIMAAGHSIGGAAILLCAVRNPELFSKIILLDPVLLEPKLVRTIRIMGLFRQTHRAPLAVRARKRRNGWDSRVEALEHFRSRPLFESWAEESLLAYVKYGLVDSTGGGVELACPPEFEAQGFSAYPTEIWRRVRRLRVPVLFVRGGNSEVITPHARDLFLHMLPGASFIELPGAGHLFPMQQPENTARIIREYADNLLFSPMQIDG
jgi:pimeloyl-ACP methyl ester carboxylesterase